MPETTTWYGFHVQLRKVKTLLVARETNLMLITPTGRRRMKHGTHEHWFPTKLEALKWRKRRAEVEECATERAWMKACDVAGHWERLYYKELEESECRTRSK